MSFLVTGLSGKMVIQRIILYKTCTDFTFLNFLLTSFVEIYEQRHFCIGPVLMTNSFNVLASRRTSFHLFINMQGFFRIDCVFHAKIKQNIAITAIINIIYL